MIVCDQCGKEFDQDEAEYAFESNVDSSIPVSYDRLNRCLCGECAIEAYENGQYFEICECCGKQFFPEDEVLNFEQQVSHKVTDAEMDEYGILCADCAASKVLAEFDDNFDEHQGYSVYDAALAWLSHGKDEDYMFGFSEEELEDAL